jgi:hypothetical protein
VATKPVQKTVPQVQDDPPFEVAARMKKVIKMLPLLIRAGITGDLALKMTGAEWGDLARLAGVEPPSEKTQALAIEALRDEAGVIEKWRSRKPPIPVGRKALTWHWVKTREVCITLERKSKEFVVRRYVDGKLQYESAPIPTEKAGRDRFESKVEKEYE